MIYEPLTKLQCCPTSDGSAAAILASEQFVIDNNLQEKVCSMISAIVFLHKISSCQKFFPSSFVQYSCYHSTSTSDTVKRIKLDYFKICVRAFLKIKGIQKSSIIKVILVNFIQEMHNLKAKSFKGTLVSSVQVTLTAY